MATKTVRITLTTVGVNISPKFDIYDNSFVNPGIVRCANVDTTDLQLGYDCANIDENATQVILVEIGGVCEATLTLSITECTTTTSTTAEPTTTTTTTEPTTTTTTTCYHIELWDVIGYSATSALDACGNPPPYTLYGDDFNLADTGYLVYSECENAAEGWYMTVGGHWRYWTGTAFTSSGTVECP